MSARVYKGRTMTAWKTIQDDLSQVGTNVVDQEVVVDKNLVTSRQPSDIPAFIRESKKLLEKFRWVRARAAPPALPSEGGGCLDNNEMPAPVRRRLLI